MDIVIKPLTPDLLQDYLYFFDNIIFEENPEWKICYCYSFHFTGTKEQWNKEENRCSAIKCINEKKITGYLAYNDGIPIGWCNANDRSNYQRLKKCYDFEDNSNDKVCSITCFLIHPDYRRKGIAQKIIEQISKDYASFDFDYVEAYPGKGDLSNESNYRGPLNLFEKLDFKIEKEYSDYYIVRKRLK